VLHYLRALNKTELTYKTSFEWDIGRGEATLDPKRDPADDGCELTTDVVARSQRQARDDDDDEETPPGLRCS